MVAKAALIAPTSSSRILQPVEAPIAGLGLALSLAGRALRRDWPIDAINLVDAGRPHL
jgi:hypothetical protein